MSAYLLDASTGALTPAPTPTISTGSRPVSVTIEASGRFAYVADGTDGKVSVYDVDAVSGMLNSRPALTVDAGQSPNKIVLSR